MTVSRRTVEGGVTRRLGPGAGNNERRGRPENRRSQALTRRNQPRFGRVSFAKAVARRGYTAEQRRKGIEVYAANVRLHVTGNIEGGVLHMGDFWDPR